MTDLEINKALALAIGWKPEHVMDFCGWIYVDIAQSPRSAGWRHFDYRDWNVIGPIAERYDAFPWRDGSWWGATVTAQFGDEHYADTPQKAIALAVIQGAKT